MDLSFIEKGLITDAIEYYIEKVSYFNKEELDTLQALYERFSLSLISPPPSTEEDEDELVFPLCDY
jgi:hypothetical protein